MEKELLFWRQAAVVIALLSLAWSLFNTFYTWRIDRRNKDRSTKLEEFRSQVRDPISATLERLKAHAKTSAALSASGNPADAIRASARNLNREVVEDLGDLRDALRDANESEFADSKDWLSDFDEQEDAILNDFNRALNDIHPIDDMKRSLIDAGEKLKRLRQRVRTRIDQQIKRVG